VKTTGSGGKCKDSSACTVVMADDGFLTQKTGEDNDKDARDESEVAMKTEAREPRQHHLMTGSEVKKR